MTLIEVLTLVGVPTVIVVVLYALQAYLRNNGFASNRKVEFVENGLIEKFVEHKRNLNERIDRVERLTLGNQDTLSGHNTRMDRQDSKISEMDRYGSKPSQRLMKMMQNMRLQQALIARHVGAEVIEPDEFEQDV